MNSSHLSIGPNKGLSFQSRRILQQHPYIHEHWPQDALTLFLQALRAHDRNDHEKAHKFLRATAEVLLHDLGMKIDPYILAYASTWWGEDGRINWLLMHLYFMILRAERLDDRVGQERLELRAVTSQSQRHDLTVPVSHSLAEA